MSDHDDMLALLAEYALGTLSQADRARVGEALRHSADLRRELAVWEQAIGQLPLALPAEKPSPALWARIDEALARPRPFAPMATRLAEALEVGVSAVHAMLDRIDLASSWVAGPSKQSKLFHIEPGPMVLAGGGLAGFVKVEAGARFPSHRHDGAETVIVLAGGFRDDDGRVYRAGDTATRAPGTEHGFEALPDEELVYLAVLRGGGVDFGSGFEL